MLFVRRFSYGIKLIATRHKKHPEAAMPKRGVLVDSTGLAPVAARPAKR